MQPHVRELHRPVNVLSIPELVEEVFSHVFIFSECDQFRYNRHLRSCAQVNRLWNKTARRFLLRRLEIKDLVFNRQMNRKDAIDALSWENIAYKDDDKGMYCRELWIKFSGGYSDRNMLTPSSFAARGERGMLRNKVRAWALKSVNILRVLEELKGNSKVVDEQQQQQKQKRNEFENPQPQELFLLPKTFFFQGLDRVDLACTIPFFVGFVREYSNLMPRLRTLSVNSLNDVSDVEQHDCQIYFAEILDSFPLLNSLWIFCRNLATLERGDDQEKYPTSSTVFTPRWPNLQNLHLSVSTSNLCPLLVHLPNLTELVVHPAIRYEARTPTISVELVNFLSQHCPRISCLLGNFESDIASKLAAQKFGAQLGRFGGACLEPHVLRTIWHSCPRLTTLVLSSNRNAGEHNILTAAQNVVIHQYLSRWPGLLHLDLSNYQLELSPNSNESSSTNNHNGNGIDADSTTDYNQGSSEKDDDIRTNIRNFTTSRYEPWACVNLQVLKVTFTLTDPRLMFRHLKQFTKLRVLDLGQTDISYGDQQLVESFIRSTPCMQEYRTTRRCDRQLNLQLPVKVLERMLLDWQDLQALTIFTNVVNMENNDDDQGYSQSSDGIPGAAKKCQISTKRLDVKILRM